MKEMPRMVNVFGVKVPVKRTELQSKGLVGLCKETHIEVDKQLQGEEATACLLHECFHYVFKRIGLCQTNLDHNLEELIVENLSVFMVENFDIKQKVKRVKKK